MSPFLPPKAFIPSPITPARIQKESKPATERKSSVDTHRPSSISAWVKHIFPSHRPERRGTLRRRGYWEQQDLTHSNQDEPNLAALDRRSRRSTTVDSNHITEWNVARDLSDGGKTNHDCEETMVVDADRKWSWAPGEDTVNRRTEIPDRNQEQGRPRVDQDRANVSAVDSSRSQSLSTAEVELIEAKKESRRLRRNLKESGDYLGVQGFNPATGQLDVVTSTESSRSSLSQETQQKLLILRKTLRDTRPSYKNARERSENQVKRIQCKSGKEKLRRLETEKEETKEAKKKITWKRHARQWSSAQEPDLSPIAQSIIGTAETSRRESNNRNSKLEHRDSASNLIDLDSSCKHPFPSSALHGDQPRARSPDSTATVVKTPHVQSLADPAEFGSSAWELFVNGISFDSSDEPVRAKDQGANMVGSQRIHMRQPDAGEQPDSGSKPDNYQETRPSDAVEGSKQSNANLEASNHGPFLDSHRQRQEDPRGETDTDSLATLTSKCAQAGILPESLHISQNVTNLSSPQKQDKRRPSPIHYNKIGEEPQPSFIMTTEQVLRRHRSESVHHIQGEPVIATGSRGRLLQNWGRWVSRRRGSQSSRPSQGNTAHMRGLHSSQASHPAVGLETIPKIPDSWQEVLTSRLGQQILAHRPETDPRGNTNSMRHQQTGTEVEEQDRPCSIAKSNRNMNKKIPSRDNGQSVAWKEIGTKQPIPVPLRYACIPITTTTGCGRQDLQVRPRKNIQRDASDPPSLRLERHLNGIKSDLPLAARSERNLGAAVMKPLQNQLLSVGHANRGIGTDIMLKNGQMQVDERMERSTRPVATISNTATTDVVLSRPKDLVSASKADTGLKKPVAHVVSKRSKVVSKISNKCETTDTNIRTEYTHTIREQVQSTAQQDQPDGPSDISQGPERFPDPKVGHTGGDGCQSSSRGNEKTEALSRAAIKEYLEMVRCHVLAFFLLYWEIVGPVFHSGSEYWARNKRHESTLADCFTLILALPVAVLAVVGLV